jgi:hypothetical protein
MLPKTRVQVKEWLHRLLSDQKVIIGQLRKQIVLSAPRVSEFIYHGSLVYGFPERGFSPVIYVAVFKKHINLGFFFGGFLNDPHKLLIGTGKRMRHITIVSKKDAQNPAIKKLLRHAWRDAIKRYPNKT